MVRKMYRHQCYQADGSPFHVCEALPSPEDHQAATARLMEQNPKWSQARCNQRAYVEILLRKKHA